VISAVRDHFDHSLKAEHERGVELPEDTGRPAGATMVFFVLKTDRTILRTEGIMAAIDAAVRAKQSAAWVAPRPSLCLRTSPNW
jgi:hypothetical protein